MIPRWTFISLILLLPLVATAQESTPPPVRFAKGNPSVEQTPVSTDYSQEPYIIEQYVTVARFENDGTGERVLTVRVRVQSDAGVQQLGELIFGYSSANEQMDVHYVRVKKADGSVVTAAPDSIKEMTASVERDAPVYTDYKEKHITVPSLHSGDTVEYEIATRVVTPFAPGQFWFQQNFIKEAIVLDERLDINVPEGRSLIVKSAAYSRPDGKEDHAARLTIAKSGGPVPVTEDFSKETSGGREILQWRHHQLTRPTDEEQAKKKSQKREDSHPDIQLTTFKSWDDVARWYADLEKGRAEPTPEIRAKAQELIQGRSAEPEKIQALYDYVSKNIRYVSLSFGLGRYQPHAASEVFANQYGDCKDKVTLLAAMLRAADISSDAVLIPFSRDLDPAVPSPSQFDHVITAVPGGKGLLWMDSTAEVAPFRLLAPALRNKSALLVTSAGAGKLVETPADPPFLSTQRVDIEGQVSDLGKLSAKLRYSIRGDNELVLRVAFRKTPKNQWKQLGQRIALLDGLPGEVTAVNPSDPAETREPFQLELEFSQPNFLDWSSKKAKLALPLLALGLPQTPEDNSEPIHLGSPLDVSMNLNLLLPPNFSAQAPVAVAVARDYAEYKSSYKFANHTLVAERSLDFKMRELPYSRTSDYLAFAHAVESDEGQVLVVENSTTGTPTIPPTSKAPELLEAGLAALNSGNPRAAIPLFQRVVELEPEHKQAWSDLGLAQLRLGQFDDAATSFRKQIAVNPYDEHAYDYLGITLQQQRKYDEAADTFRKQLGVNPLDPIAHAALGGLYLEQHKYSEAVPELDKASVLMPDNAGIQVSLGQAYLNTGDKENALAAFQKAVELSQTPTVWNNVAYNLADHRLDLDKAEQYAESAVSATAANLRNVELSHLTLDQLNEVQSIGAYWDTLGWVYFQKNDLDTAEKFVRASWLLNQHGEVADHLGQIAEKRGQKDAASRLYALAIAAPHSVPETRGRLASLLGLDAKDKKIDQLVADSQPELLSLRTIPAGKMVNEKVEADFFVLLSPSNPSAKAGAAQFISGSEKLRPIGARLRSLDFGPMFPDASPARLIRRGTLSCSSSGDCNFLLVLPEDVRTVN
jgi:tetratricopeptide (TPR) repeat protein/transglutaminase-like putative cysteine protease